MWRRGRQLCLFVQFTSPVEHPTDPMGRERAALPNRRPDTIDARHSDRPEAVCSHAELLCQLQIPTRRQDNILVQADRPVRLGALNAQIETIRSSVATFDQNDLMGRAISEAWRREQVGSKAFIIRVADDEA